MSDIKPKLEAFLVAARAAYEEAKINCNTGKCTADQLENVRLSLDKIESMAAALPSSNCTCGGSLDQPADEHDISCPLAIAPAYRNTPTGGGGS